LYPPCALECWLTRSFHFSSSFCADFCSDSASFFADCQSELRSFDWLSNLPTSMLSLVLMPLLLATRAFSTSTLPSAAARCASAALRLALYHAFFCTTQSSLA